MFYNKLEIGDHVYDKFFDAYGTVKKMDDIHNVFVEYENGGSGLYCLDSNCDEYDGALKLIKQ